MTDRDQAAAPSYSANAVHMLRTTQQINVTLSQMADQKASILMGATFVVFTLGIGQAKSSGLTPPLALLVISAFIAAALAVLAVLPASKAPAGDANLLFFGAFSQLSEEEFVARVLARLHDDEQVFRTMLKDTYQNGRVLQRKKYRYLGYAYRVFLVGLAATLLAFVAEQARLIP